MYQTPRLSTGHGEYQTIEARRAINGEEASAACSPVVECARMAKRHTGQDVMLQRIGGNSACIGALPADRAGQCLAHGVSRDDQTWTRLGHEFLEIA